jgi:hypothetical protein
MFSGFSRYSSQIIKPRKLKSGTYKIIFIIFTAFAFQSCIEITEEVTVHEDQSGRFSLSVGTGGSNPLLALIGQYTDLKVTDEIRERAQELSYLLKNQEGISNVKFTESRWKGNMSLSFDFENGKKLNEALYAAAGSQKTIFQPNIYKIRNHKFVRKNTTKWLLWLLEQEKEQIPDEVLFDLVEVKSVYNVPHEVRKVRSALKYRTSNNMQTFTTTNFLTDLVEDEINTKIKIKY